MSHANSPADDGNTETVQVNIRLTQTFLDDIDATWQEQGFNSRSEFLRHAARDAVKHPDFSREGWKQIASSEHDLRAGDADLVSREQLINDMSQQDDD